MRTKEKPMKVIVRDWFAICPRCGEVLGVEEDKSNYCPNCGQRLEYPEVKK